MSLPLPIAQSTVGATGAAAEAAVTVSGIKTGNVLLALARYTPGEAPAAVDTSSFVVADGTITSDTEDTSGYHLAVVYHRG